MCVLVRERLYNMDRYSKCTSRAHRLQRNQTKNTDRKKSPAGQTIPFSVTVRQDRDGDVNRLRSDNLINILLLFVSLFFSLALVAMLTCFVLFLALE